MADKVILIPSGSGRIGTATAIGLASIGVPFGITGCDLERRTGRGG